MPPRARPRRGAWWGSQQAKAFAAACLAAVLLTLAAAGPAAAYRCEEAATPPVMTSRDDCRVPRDETAGSPRKTKRGTMGSVTVLVLSVAAVLLIPIGARGLPSSIDPYRD
jgi:hypothetical protein